jgi:gliding motility-associated lipoprotein GldD
MYLFRKSGLAALFLIIMLNSCEQATSPLPRGYMRIALPQKEYVLFDTVYPYTFEYPAYAEIRPDKRASAEPYWADMAFPRFKATIHLSYKKPKSTQDIYEFFDDGRNFVNKHIPKSTGFRERVYENDETGVYGILYEIRGPEAASPFQFYLTDSTNHFLRGALYFNLTPNNDSLAPVINFLRDDILHLIETLRWKPS